MSFPDKKKKKRRCDRRRDHKRMANFHSKCFICLGENLYSSPLGEGKRGWVVGSSTQGELVFSMKTPCCEQLVHPTCLCKWACERLSCPYCRSKLFPYLIGTSAFPSERVDGALPIGFLESRIDFTLLRNFGISVEGHRDQSIVPTPQVREWWRDWWYDRNEDFEIWTPRPTRPPPVWGSPRDHVS